MSVLTSLTTAARAIPSASVERRLLLPLVYLAGITVAEYLTAVVSPQMGLPAHALLLGGLLLNGAHASDDAARKLLWAMTIAPLIRILSLSLPLAGFPVIFWFAIISIPVFASAAVLMRTLDFTPAAIGLVVRPKTLLLAALMVPLGLFLGIGEYYILQPPPFARNLSLGEVWLPVLILSVCTGFEEELIFRGMLQRAAQGVMGFLPAVLFVTGLFTVLHIGYLSVLNLVFVFSVGLIFAAICRRTGSIIEASVAHSCVNISLFILTPNVLRLLS